MQPPLDIIELKMETQSVQAPKDLLEGKISQRALEELSKIQELAGKRTILSQQGKSVKIAGLTESGIVITEEETVRENFLSSLVFSLRVFLGEKIARITSKTSRQSPLSEKTLHQRDDLFGHKTEIAERDMHEIETELTAIRTSLEQIVAIEKEKAEIKKMQIEAAQIQARNPMTSNPYSTF